MADFTAFDDAWQKHDYHALAVPAGKYPHPLFGEADAPTRYFLGADAIDYVPDGENAFGADSSKQIPSQAVHDRAVTPVAWAEGDALIVEDPTQLPRLCDVLRAAGYTIAVWAGYIAGGSQIRIEVAHPDALD